MVGFFYNLDLRNTNGKFKSNCNWAELILYKNLFLFVDLIPIFNPYLLRLAILSGFYFFQAEIIGVFETNQHFYFSQIAK